MLDDCMTHADSPIYRWQAIDTHQQSINRNLLFDFKNAGDHTPISPFTIMGKDFHPKCHESVYDPHHHSRTCAMLPPTFATPLPCVHCGALALVGTSGVALQIS